MDTAVDRHTRFWELSGPVVVRLDMGAPRCPCATERRSAPERHEHLRRADTGSAGPLATIPHSSKHDRGGRRPVFAPGRRDFSIAADPAT